MYLRWRLHPPRYPPPVVPAGFNPFHTFATAGPAFTQHRLVAGSDDNVQGASGGRGKHHNLSAQQREDILGGTTAQPQEPKSVFDYLKPEDRERLFAARNALQQRTNTGAGAVPPPPPPGPPPSGPPPSGPPPPHPRSGHAPPPMPPPSYSPQVPLSSSSSTSSRSFPTLSEYPRPPPGMTSKTAVAPGVFRPFQKVRAAVIVRITTRHTNAHTHTHTHTHTRAHAHTPPLLCLHCVLFYNVITRVTCTLEWHS